MLKNFIKNNFIVSSLLFLSLIIININFFRFFQNNATYQFDSWMSNYQGGFVRRGIPGEIFYQIHNLLDIHLGWMIFIFVCFLYILFYFVFFLLIDRIKLDRIIIFAIFSPLSFYFPILNSKATGHKEIIFLLLLSVLCYFIPKIKKNEAKYIIIFISIFSGLSHEGLLFYSIYLIIPYLLFFNFKSYKEILFNITPIVLIILLLFSTNYYFRGSEKHVVDICNSLKVFVNTQCQTSGQIAHLGLSLEGYASQKISEHWYHDYFKIYGIGFILGFLPLFILFYKMKLSNFSFCFSRINSLNFLFFPLIMTFPIYLIGADWGRYLYISYTSSLIILIFCLSNNICFIEEKIKPIKNNIYSKSLFIIAILFYGFGWSVPVCCEKNFKPGIFKGFNKIVYYYKKNN